MSRYEIIRKAKQALKETDLSLAYRDVDLIDDILLIALELGWLDQYDDTPEPPQEGSTQCDNEEIGSVIHMLLDGDLTKTESLMFLKNFFAKSAEPKENEEESDEDFLREVESLIDKQWEEKLTVRNKWGY